MKPVSADGDGSLDVEAFAGLTDRRRPCVGRLYICRQRHEPQVATGAPKPAAEGLRGGMDGVGSIDLEQVERELGRQPPTEVHLGRGRGLEREPGSGGFGCVAHDGDEASAFPGSGCEPGDRVREARPRRGEHHCGSVGGKAVLGRHEASCTLVPRMNDADARTAQGRDEAPSGGSPDAKPDVATQAACRLGKGIGDGD